VQTIEWRTDEATLRDVIAQLLASRRDASPSELVELLGGHVLWGQADAACGPARPNRAPA
jgi:hypothetical protein